MTDTVFSYKYQLTQEIPAAIMNARLNVLDIGATDGRNGSAEDSRGRVTADDGGRGCSLCRQQYVADSTAGRSHQRCLQLSEVAGGPGGASSAGAAETSRANSEVGYRGIHHLSRGRQEAEDAETASAVDLQYDARRIPDEMGAGTRIIRWWRQTMPNGAPSLPKKSDWDGAPGVKQREQRIKNQTQKPRSTRNG